MTRIKYTTIGVSRKTEHISIVRGKKTGQIGFRQPDEDDEESFGSIVKGLFGDPIYAEEVVTLPEPMSPDEWDDYIEELDDPDSAVAQATMRVAEEHGIEKDDWWFLRDDSGGDGE